MLSYVQSRLVGKVRSTWASDEELRGQLVALYRRYADGEHRAKLTPEMRAMLRLDGLMDRFNVNYCDLVASSLANRLVVMGIEGDNSTATQWAKDVMDGTRFDALQMDVHESALVDGDAYVMVSFNEKTKVIEWAYEPAYDGDTGMVVVYNRTRKKIIAAIKIWYEGDDRCLNLYIDGKIEKMKLWSPDPKKGETVPRLAPRDESKPEDKWEDQQDNPLSVPVIHFKNRGKSSDTHGKSELAKIIPPQDILNRIVTSMTAAGELGAFQVRTAIGFPAPAAVQPGMIINIAAEGLSKDDFEPKMGTLEQATPAPFIAQAEFTIDQIVNISQTPLVGSGGSNDSGEALKQRAEGQVGKAQACQVRFGNVWEDGIKLSVEVNNAYTVNKKAPDSKLWKTIWKDAQTRNEDNVIKNAMMTRDVVGDLETMREIGKVRGYDEKKIKAIMAEKDEEASAAMRQTRLPGFDQFGAGTDLNEPVNPSPPTPLPQGTRGDQTNAQVIDPAAFEQALALEAAQA